MRGCVKDFLVDYWGFPVLNTATPEGPSDVGVLVGKYNAVVCRPEAVWRRKPGMVVCGLHTSPWRHHLHLQHTCTIVPSFSRNHATICKLQMWNCVVVAVVTIHIGMATHSNTHNHLSSSCVTFPACTD